jgi:hypothetical protein
LDEVDEEGGGSVPGESLSEFNKSDGHCCGNSQVSAQSHRVCL